jgi:hypothetical protein
MGGLFWGRNRQQVHLDNDDDDHADDDDDVLMFELQYVSYVALHKMIKNCEWTGTWK